MCLTDGIHVNNILKVCLFVFFLLKGCVWILFWIVKLQIPSISIPVRGKIKMCHSFSVSLFRSNSRFIWILFFYIRGQKYRKLSTLLKSTWKGNEAYDNSLCNSTLTWDTLYGESCWHLPVLIHCQERVLVCRCRALMQHITNFQITPLSRTPVFQVVGWAYKQMGHKSWWICVINLT